MTYIAAFKNEQDLDGVIGVFEADSKESVIKALILWEYIDEGQEKNVVIEESKYTRVV